MSSGTPTAPTMVKALPMNGMVRLTWQPPAFDGQSPVKTWKVYRGTTSGAETYLTSVAAGTLLINDAMNGVTNGTTYFYKISAVNDYGEGSQSAEVSATPLATIGKPAAPALKTVISDGKQITITWTAGADNGLPITAYRIHRATHAGAAARPIYVKSAALTFTDTNVTPGASYWYVIVAENESGASPASNELMATVGTAPKPPSGVPFAPTIVKCQGVNGAVSLQWLAPAFDGQSDVKTYRIYRDGKQLTAFEATVTDTIDGMSVIVGQPYTYEITAGNDYGEGPRSVAKSASPISAGRPGAVSLVSAVPGDKQVALTWTAPTQTGGLPISGYNVYRGTTPGAAAKGPVYVKTPNVLNFTDRNVLNDEKYYYVVTAVNEAFPGYTYSNELSATPTAAAPPQPIQTQPSAPTSVKAAPASILISWALPGNDGGSPVTGYKVYRGRTAGGETFLAQVGLVTNFTDAQISPGTTYFYKVSAVNAVGESPLSIEVSQ